jgi:hypothetical protein
MYALAVAPVPPPPVILTVGGLVYNVPGLAILIAVILKPTLSFQFLSG